MGSSSWFLIHRTGPTMGTKSKTALLLFSLPFFVGSGYTAEQVDVAFLRKSPNGIYYISTTKEIIAEDSIYLQYLDSKKVIRCCKIFSAENMEKQKADEAVIDAAFDKKTFTYKIINQINTNSPNLAIAVVGRSLQVRGVGERIEVRTAGRSIFASSCTGAEGINLLLKDRSRILSHLYLNLGYDLERSTCKESDLQSRP
jgi:hypothetical protein